MCDDPGRGPGTLHRTAFVYIKITFKHSALSRFIQEKKTYIGPNRNDQ